MLPSPRLLRALALSAAALSPLSPLSPLSTPSEAFACGGFFCNANQPVNQSAERIVFARAEGRIDMHVQVAYQGPPTEFGWLLPAHPSVETTISSEALFGALDRLFGPRFQLNYTYADDCQLFDFALEESAPPSAEPNAGGGVQVLSREAIGPYDRAILLPESVADLRAWLDENNYQIPNELDAKLQPYIDLNLAFVAIKLLPGLDAGDIAPLRMSFPGDRPSIPLIPTAVAADPDMGVIVHVLDQARAVPVNYRHVTINEATIDWASGGNNYTAVVSQAVDEAGGRAFVTDYAGPVGERLSDVLSPYSEQELERIASATTLFGLMDTFDDRTNPDLHRVLANFVEVPEGQDPSDFFRCVQCGDSVDQAVDGAQIAEALRVELNEVYEVINATLSGAPYLTRLYSTLSAHEMDRDPIFSINPDLSEVSNVHIADAHVTCTEDGSEQSTTVTLADGRSFELEQATPIQRQEGETVRGGDVPAAAAVEQMFEAGQPEVLSEATPEEMTPVGGAEVNPEAGAEAGAEMSSGGASEDKGGCEQGQNTTLPLLSLLMVLCGVVVRRVRRLNA